MRLFLLAQRWVGEIILIVYDPQESWGLSLLVGERRVGLGRCKVAAWIASCSIAWDCSGEEATRLAYVGAAERYLTYIEWEQAFVQWAAQVHVFPFLLLKNKATS